MKNYIRRKKVEKMNGYYIFLIVVMVAITIMYIAEKIADIFKAKYENTEEKSGENENTKEVQKK